MTRRDWRGWIRTRIVTVADALEIVLLVAVALGIFWFGFFWFDWDWKALIGWRALVDYVNPKNATGRRDAIQVYAVIVAGGIAAITAAVGLLNLGLTRRSLKQQRELEAQRAQGAALQAYYEQMGKLLSEYDLRNTEREEIRELARGQTLTVLQELEASRKGSLLIFLHGAGLIGTENPAVALTGANLQGVALRSADLRGASLQEASLQGANLQEASLQGANLRGAILQGASLQSADLQGAFLASANLQGAFLQKADLLGAIIFQGFDLNLHEHSLYGAEIQGASVPGADLRRANLQGAIMPNGQKYEDWLKDKESNEEDAEHE